MRVLITGINGFIGKHLVSALISGGHLVSGLDRQEKPLVENINNYFSGDVLDKIAVEKALEGAEAVVHLAALTSHKDIVDNKFESLEINFLGTKNVLDAFSKSDTAKKFIYSSTGKVYGDIKSLPITEDHPTLPLNILGKSKLITEKLIDFYASESNKSFVIFRIFQVFGLGQSENFLVPTILKQLEESNKIVLGDIKAKRDYIYINDAIKAFVLAIEKEIGPGLSLFNICSGEARSAKDIVDEISKIKNIPVEIEINPDLLRKDEKEIEYGSFEKAKKILDWQPQHSLQKGLEETINLTK